MMIKIATMIGGPDLDQETLAVFSGDLVTAFKKVAELGYDGVELMIKNPVQLDGAEIRGWLKDSRLELVGLCTGHVFGEEGLGLVGPDPERCRRAMTRLEAFVRFAAEFGAGTLVNIGRSRGPGFPGDKAHTLERMTESFQELADYAEPYGIRIVLEPINVHQATYIHTTQDGIAMVESVKRPNFGLMLDVYHMNIEDVDIYDSIREAGAFCWFLHFADNNRKWPGSAHLNFEKIVSTLNEIGYDGFVSLEILPWPDPDAAAQSSIEYLREFIPSCGS